MIARIDDHVGHVNAFRIRRALGARSPPGVVIIAAQLGKGQQAARCVIHHGVFIAEIEWKFDLILHLFVYFERR